MKKHLILAATAALLAGPALAQDKMKGMDMAGSPADQAYMQSMQAMQQKMQDMKPTGDANKDFVTMMKPHHEAAVEMAEAYLKYGSDPQLKKMAQDIVSSQKKEIKEMDAWQTKHAK